MQLVIDIPEEIYKASKNMMLTTGRGYGKMLTSIIYGAIATGTPLPKGHGRLIDANVLQEEMEKDVRRAMSFVDLTNFVWLAPTVIKEDNEE